MKTTATTTELYKAMRGVNEAYDGNLAFNREPDCRGKWTHFTLRVNNSKGKGARRGFSGRRLTAACWHAHRDFMRALYAVNPKAVIKTAHADYYDSEHFESNYQATDINIGSIMNPLKFSEACDCGKMANAM